MPPAPRTNDDTIRPLPDHIANQIAAGEVIERPASVVKELLENALDAGASHIDLAILQGGRTLIEIADNGTGMTRPNALAAFQRHATSKLAAIHDLETLGTLGFRGEALPSIASVSRLTLKTCRRGETLGTGLAIEGGVQGPVSDIARPPGATFTIRDLFYNLPARRKFLRAAQTEQAHIKSILIHHALAHPAVSFHLKADGRQLLRLPPAANLGDRIADLFSLAFATDLIPFSGTSASEPSLSLHGFIAPAHAATRATDADQYIFVNNRPAAAPILHHAIRQSLIDPSRRPPLFLFIHLSPSLVDVNVHPAKREVRFRHPSEVRDLLIRVLTLALQPLPPSRLQHPASFSLPPPDVSSIRPLSPPVSNPSPLATPNYSPPDTTSVTPPDITSPLPSPPCPPSPCPPPALPIEIHFPPPATPPTPAPPASVPFSFQDYRFICQTAARYLLFENNDGLLLLDPRAARQRILFEKLLERFLADAPCAQRLLLPETLTLSPRPAELIRRHHSALTAMGFELAELTPDTFIIEAAPPELCHLSLRPLLSDIAQDLQDLGSKRASDRLREELLIQAVCRALPDPSSAPDESGVTTLLQSLLRCSKPYISPSGRPTMVFTSFTEIDRKFGQS